jgi:hypothetical protein
MTHLGDAAFDDLRGEHFAGLRDAMTACGDEEVKSTGDGLLVTLPPWSTAWPLPSRQSVKVTATSPPSWATSAPPRVIGPDA